MSSLSSFLNFLCNNSFALDNLQINYFAILLLAITTFLALLQIALDKLWMIFNISIFFLSLKVHIFFALFIIPIAYVLKKINYLELDFKIRLVGTLLIVFFLSHLSTNNVYNPVMRHWKMGLGFGNPNTLGLYSLILLMEFTFFKKISNKWLYYSFFVLFLCLLAASDSRTAILLYIIFIILKIIFSKHKCFKIPIITGLTITPFVCFIFSLGKTYWYQSFSGPLIKKVDLEFTNRWQQAAKFLSVGYSAFGRPVHSVSGNYLDAGYINLLLESGIIPTVIILFLLSVILFSLLKQKNYQLFIPIFIMCLYGISENMSIINNPF